MKILIICFSQTGNTLRVAKSIREGIMSAGSHCDIVAFEKAESEGLDNYDAVGLGSPVFYYKEPFHVKDWIESLPPLKSQKWFVFCTHGNVIGNFFPSIVGKLKKKEARVVGIFHSYAEMNVPFYPFPSFTSGHPDETDLNEAKSFGTKIASNAISTKSKGKDAIENIPTSSKVWIKESQRLTRNFLAEKLPKLHIDPEACNKCRLCENLCPVGGIDIDKEPPRIQKPCVYCWRCVNICPSLAVKADWEPLVKMAPVHFAKYREELEKAKMFGEFRWLIDPDTIDFKKPLIKQLQKNRLIKRARFETNR